MRCRPDTCQGCPLYECGSDFSQVEGHGSLGVMIIAEANGEHEAREQLPLRSHAPSGMVFERTLRRLGYSRDQFAVTNILRCRPPQNVLDGASYELQAIAHCQQYLLAALRQHRPKVIVAFGNLPFRTLTGISGEKRTISHMRGYVFRALPEFCAAAGTPDLLVVPTFHPAFLRRGAISLTGVLARDIQRAVNIRAGKDTSYILDMPADEADAEVVDAWQAAHSLRYLTRPTLRELDLFCRDVKARSDAWQALPPDMRAASYLALSHDIETQESASLDEDTTDGFQDTRIVLSQFSIEPGSGIAMPWRDDFIRATRFLLKLPLPKTGHNYWLFDQKVLRAVGQRDLGDASYMVPAGDVHDTLQMFHYWQPDLPAHLQFAASFTQFPFPWKHFNGTNLAFYGCVDVDATLRTYRVVRRTMEDRRIWIDSQQPARAAAGYVHQVHEVRPVLAAMEDRGMPVNNERRLALGEVFDATEVECMIDLDARFPNEARKLQPKTGYKGVPPQVKPLLAEGKSLAEIATIVFHDPPKQQEDGSMDDGESYRYEQRSFEELQFDDQSRVVATSIARWCRVYQFSPNSAPQLYAYMKAKGHKAPFNKKKGRDTTEKKELERLSAKHKDNFYTKVIECREVRKMKSTYIDGWRPHADGRVHTTFTFATATGQLSSRNPNTQNYVAHGKLGKAIKSMIAAPDGYEISNWDFKSYHVVMLGFLAEDPDYIRMARIDMHSFVTWHFLKLPDADRLTELSDEELIQKFKWLKSNEKYLNVRNKQAKPSILGIGLGLMPPHLYEMNREHFESLKQAKQFREVIQQLFPKVFRWQNRIVEQAHQQQVLYSSYGMLRWFYEVQSPNGKGGWKPGDQYNAAMAFPVQNNAHGDLRERLKAMHRSGIATRYGLCNTIHDSVSFCYPIELREQHIAETYPILTSPSRVLVHPTIAPAGLCFGVECTVGPNMADRTEIKLIG